MARIEGIELTGAQQEERPVLRRGSTGEAVGQLHAMLQKLKFPLAIDEDFGAATELAVMRFQTDRKLTPDCISAPKPGMRWRGKRSEAPLTRARISYI